MARRSAPAWGIAVHGGAGTMPARDMTPSREAAYRSGLQRALAAGHAVLEGGGASLDAVVAAVRVLEDSPLFNAGKGAVFNADSRHEMDAAVMDGATLRAGAVACVQRIRNPIVAARAVMEHSDHVLLAGTGAERFARRVGIEMVAPSWFDTGRRLAALRKVMSRRVPLDDQEVHGTVGAVALDRSGSLAAGTSTGGRTGKLPGRIGDSPLIGAGTYADDETCAVSGTGHGEMFIRCVLAHDVAARMRHAGATLARAASGALAGLDRVGGEGGFIAIDRRGRVAMPFNTQGMYRGCMGRDGVARCAIFRE